MEAEKNKDKNWVDDAAHFVETYRSLITLRMVEQLSLGASLSILGIIALLFIVCALIFVGLGIAWWLGEAIGNRATGFLIIGGVYSLLLVVLLSIVGKFLLSAIRNQIIKKIYEQH